MDQNLLNKIFPYDLWQRLKFRKNIFQFLGLFLLIVSLAGPQIGHRLQEVKMKAGRIFILVDCSDSMLTEDFKPNRMEKAKRVLSALLEKWVGSKVGIIAFAGEPYVYCPLTFDSSAVKQFLKTIEPNMIPQPGSRMGSAIRLAVSKFTQDESADTILLLTDGEDHHSDPISAAKEAQDRGVKIFVIGIGNPDGEPIPIRDGSGNITSYKKDKKGEVVISRLGEPLLAEISLLTGGSYFRASDSEQEIDLLSEKISEQQKKTDLLQKENRYENRYQWFLVLAFIFLILSDSLPFSRRKTEDSVGEVGGGGGEKRRFSYSSPLHLLPLLFFLGSILLLTSPPLFSESFRKKMREGNELFSQKKYSEALESYQEAGQKKTSDPRANFNQGAAHYRLNDWEKAAESFQKSALNKKSSFAAKSFYNLGNSQFQKGDYAEAIRSYQKSLRLDPSDPETKFNLQLALQFKNHPPPKQKKRSEEEKEKQESEMKKGEEGKENEKKEKEENAKRILKSVTEGQKDKPIFKPDSKKNKKEYEEDW